MEHCMMIFYKFFIQYLTGWALYKCVTTQLQNDLKENQF